MNELDIYSKKISSIKKTMNDIINNLKKYDLESTKNNLPDMKSALLNAEKKLQNFKTILDNSKNENTVKNLELWLVSEKDGLKNKHEIYIERYISDLQKHLAEFGFDFKGHFPSFKTRNLKVKSDPGKYKILILYGGDEEKLSGINGFDGKSVASAVKAFYSFLEQIDYQKELNLIFTAYTNSVKKSEKSLGEWHSIIGVMNEYFSLNSSPNLQVDKYPARIIFSFIIYRILQGNLTANEKFRLNKKTAIHGAASKKEEHLWLPITREDVQGENVMYLNFSEA